MGADVNRQNSKGQTPLMTGILHKVAPEDLLPLVNSLDLSLDLSDNMGNTALMYAVEAGSPGLVRLLSDLIVKRGQFRIFVLRNAENETAEQIALRIGDRLSAQILNKRRLKLLDKITKQLRDREEAAGSFGKTQTPGGVSKSLNKASPFHQVAYAQSAVKKWKKLAARSENVLESSQGRKRAFSAVRMKDLLPPISENDVVGIEERARSASMDVLHRNVVEESVTFDDILKENLQVSESSDGVLNNFVLAVSSMSKSVCTAVLFAKKP